MFWRQASVAAAGGELREGPVVRRWLRVLFESHGGPWGPERRWHVAMSSFQQVQPGWLPVE